MFSRHPGDDRMTENDKLKCRFCGDCDISISLRNHDAVCKRCCILLKEIMKLMEVRVTFE
jgi:hypothetical protein